MIRTHNTNNWPNDQIHNALNRFDIFFRLGQSLIPKRPGKPQVNFILLLIDNYALTIL